MNKEMIQLGGNLFIDDDEHFNEFNLNNDPVNHPKHYNVGNVECIELIKSVLTEEEYRGYLKGNAIKYTYRAPYKGNEEQDLGKRKWYCDELKRTLNK
jgi:hypothetical protein